MVFQMSTELRIQKFAPFSCEAFFRHRILMEDNVDKLSSSAYFVESLPTFLVYPEPSPAVLKILDGFATTVL